MGSSVWHCVCVLKSLYFCPHTLFRMCICISTCIYVHLTLHVCSIPYAIVTWKHRCPCTELCVCPSHPASGPIPWLKCVHALIHVFMSTQLPMLAQPPIDSYVETWVLMCVIVCISVTLILVPHLGKNVYMHQYMYLCHLIPPVCFTPLAYLHGNVGSSVWHCVCVQVTLLMSPHLV